MTTATKNFDLVLQREPCLVDHPESTVDTNFQITKILRVESQLLKKKKKIHNPQFHSKAKSLLLVRHHLMLWGRWHTRAASFQD